MKLSERYDEITAVKILGGRALKRDDVKDEIAQLDADNTRRLRALKAVRDWIGPNSEQLSRREIVEIMDAAIAKAK